jgi:hypothetical protein
MADGRDHKGDYYRQKVTVGRVEHVAHGDGPMETSAQIEESANIRFQIGGKPPQNEEGNQRVARQLADALTIRDGAQWTAEAGAPAGPERGIDWNLIDSHGAARSVQITRVGSSERWRRARTDGVMGTVTVSQAADEIDQAIRHKLPSQDARTILALSTGQPGFCGFTEVVAEFKRTCLPQLTSLLQFAEVWVVGHSPETTIAVWPENDGSRQPTG